MEKKSKEILPCQETDTQTLNPDVSQKEVKKTRKKELTEEERALAQLALEALLPQEPQQISSLDNLEQVYKKKSIEDRIDSLKYSAEGNSFKTLYLSEILAGNNTSDIPFLRETIEKIKQLPKEYQPDLIVVSGLLEGDFEFRNKDRSSNLVLSLDDQFVAAKLILKELEGLNANIIYSVSSEDREIIRDGTIKAMRMLANTAKPLLDKNKATLSYWQIDQLKQNPAWDIHLKFWTRVVFEYCLRSGRRLKSAEEVQNITGGELMMEEYLMLYNAFQKMARGQDIPQTYREVLEIDNISLPDKIADSFEVVDDVNLTLNTKSSEFTQKIRHNFKFSPKPMTRTPLDVAEATLNQLAAEGKTPPKAFVTMHQQQALGVGNADGSWLISTGGFLDSARVLDQKGSVSSAGFPPAWRNLTTRKIINFPTATSHEFTDDGRHKITFFNKKLLEKADSAPRTTILTITDWQTGSSAARPDLQIKLLDLAVSEILPKRPMFILCTGDIYHGQNYQGLSMENFRTGLIRLEDQQRYVEELLERETEHIPIADLANIEGVSIEPGNHEWNSSYVRTGAIFNRALASFFRDLLGRVDRVKAREKVKAGELLDTPYGDVVVAWTSFDEIAGYGVLSQHMMLEKGGKGRGGSPIYHAQKFIEGAGDLAQKIDVTSSGHWHHNQYAVFGNKLHVINPSVEGLTGYEWMRGLRPTPGGALIHLGGGLPPEVEFLSLDTLLKHEIKNGYFSNANLLKEGFRDDDHFDPKSHGFFHEKSALQKALWQMINEMNRTIHSHL